MKGTRGEQRRRRRSRRRRRGQNLTGHQRRGRQQNEGHSSVCGKVVVRNLIFFAKGNSSLAPFRRPV